MTDVDIVFVIVISEAVIVIGIQWFLPIFFDYDHDHDHDHDFILDGTVPSTIMYPLRGSYEFWKKNVNYFRT